MVDAWSVLWKSKGMGTPTGDIQPLEGHPLLSLGPFKEFANLGYFEVPEYTKQEVLWEEDALDLLGSSSCWISSPATWIASDYASSFWLRFFASFPIGFDIGSDGFFLILQRLALIRKVRAIN